MFGQFKALSINSFYELEDWTSFRLWINFLRHSTHCLRPKWSCYAYSLDFMCALGAICLKSSFDAFLACFGLAFLREHGKVSTLLSSLRSRRFSFVYVSLSYCYFLGEWWAFSVSTVDDFVRAASNCHCWTIMEKDFFFSGELSAKWFAREPMTGKRILSGQKRGTLYLYWRLFCIER